MWFESDLGEARRTAPLRLPVFADGGPLLQAAEVDEGCSPDPLA
jgi:hypothetical protein